jgi:two-component system response regulator
MESKAVRGQAGTGVGELEAASRIEPGTEAAPAVGARLQPVRRETGRRPTVLVIEDDPDDRDMIGWAFEECRDHVELRFVEDGREALDYLYRFGRYQCRDDAPRPSMILLDLTLPRISGEEILIEIRRDVDLRRIPVIVFTRSTRDADVIRCYDLGANAYMAKPDSMDGYLNAIRILEAYWLRKAELPPPPG